MRLVTFACLTALVLPSFALADDQLDTFEDLSERSNTIIFGMMIDMAVEEGADRATLEAALPAFEWNDAMRTAGGCMIDRYRAELGRDGVDAMLGKLSGFLDETEGMTMDEFTDASAEMMPEGITEEMSIEITQDCGMIDAQMDWMSSTGFMEALFAAQ